MNLRVIEEETYCILQYDSVASQSYDEERADYPRENHLVVYIE